MIQEFISRMVLLNQCDEDANDKTITRSQLRQLNKTTRHRVSESSARITTEMVDEAHLMQRRISNLSSRAARISSRAFKGLSYHGELPPPPPMPPVVEYESSNPLYTAGFSPNGSTPNFARVEEDGPTVLKPHRSTKQAADPILATGIDNITWLAKKMSLRFSFRELRRAAESSKPEMVSVPLPIIGDSDSKGHSSHSTTYDESETIPEEPRSIPKRDTLWKPNTSFKPKESPPVITLNPKFEEYRMREFFARRSPQQPVVPRQAAVAKTLPIVTSPPPSTAVPNLPTVRSVKELRQAFSGGQQNSQPYMKSNSASSLTSSKGSSAGGQVIAKQPIPSPIAAGSSSASSAFNFKKAEARVVVEKIKLNEVFEQYRIREFRRLQLLAAAREKEAQQPQPKKLIPVAVAVTLKSLNSTFEEYRHREFKRLHMLNQAVQMAMAPDPVPISPPTSASLGKPTSRSSYVMPPSQATGATPSRVIKRTSGVKREEMPVLHEEASTPNLHERSHAMVDFGPYSNEGFPPELQAPPAPSMHSFPTRADMAQHQSTFPISPTNSMDFRPERSKRGSLVQRALRVISGTFGSSSGSAAILPPPPPPPPEFPFSDFELLQLDMHRAEQQIQFREYTHLSTVYETRNEYAESVSSAAAEAFDAERRAKNMATL